MRFSVLAPALSLLMGSAIVHAEEQETPEVGETSVENVDMFFATDSAELSPEAHSDLQALADWAKCGTGNAIILEGHADPRGTAEYNMKLSGQRAAAVRQSLIDMGVPSQQIVVTLYGEFADQDESYGEQRRVTARASTTPVEPADL